MRITDTADSWWKNTVLYCVDVEKFFDANNDGVGDLSGVAERIDYLAELGVGCLWLMPFYETPNRDDGYDISDFYGVDPRLGSLGDFVELIETAHSRGMRVIVDLVINHTSDRHPWFEQACSSKDDPYRDYYIWRSDPPPDTSSDVIFTGEQDSIWTFEEHTDEWYLHRFYPHQPDLNLSNPKVRDEIFKVIGFWLQLGVDGFRVDAVPQVLTVGIADEKGEGVEDPHGFLRELRIFLAKRASRPIMLGEVNLTYDEGVPLFGEEHAGELTMMFDFPAMQHMYLSLARADPSPLRETLRSRPSIPNEAQWVTFIRNHDELTLDQLTDDERQEVFEAFAPEERMRAYGRGIRRRLPTMLDGDMRRIRMVYSLLFSLPGTPALYYGEEIGMGERLDVDSVRGAVRTAMQWTAGPSGGFSVVDPEDVAPPVVEGEFGPERVNVASAKSDPDSLLAFVHLLGRRYREAAELAWGDYEVLDLVDGVLAHRCTLAGSQMIVLHNFTDEPVTVPLDIDHDGETVLVDLIDLSGHDPDAVGHLDIELEPYGFRWLRVHRSGERYPLLPHISTAVDTRGDWEAVESR